jgi:hypothetical protein
MKKPYKTNDIEEFDLDMYLCKVWISIGADNATLINMFNEDFANINTSKSRAFTAFTIRTKPDTRKGILLYFKDSDKMTVSTIVHEAIHAALGIYANIGAQVDLVNQEPFAYLVDWITRCAEQWLQVKFKATDFINHDLSY